MGWLLTLVIAVLLFLAVYLLDRKPNTSLTIAVVVPFILWYVIGRLGGEVIFTFFAGLLIVVMNIMSRYSVPEDQ